MIKLMNELPFFAGKEVESPYFFNRVGGIVELTRKIGSNAPLNIALHGQRRIGKSSILKKLYREFLGSNTIIPILIKCEKVFPMSANNFAKLIIMHLRYLTESGNAFRPPNEEEILKRVKQRRIDIEVAVQNNGIEKTLKTTSEFKDVIPEFNLYMDVAFEMIKEIQKHNEMKLVFLMDEFQELFVLGDGFLWALRGYMADSKASFMVSSSDHRFYEYLRKDSQHPFFNFFETKKILGVKESDARKYIRGRLKLVDKKINEESMNYILKLCEGKPYYIQLLCAKAYDILLRKNQETITLEILKESFNEIFISPPAHLTSMFRTIRGKIAQEVFITMCKYNLRSSAEIAIKLDLRTSSVSQTLTQLEKLHGIIESTRGKIKKYKVVDGFLKEWIKKEYQDNN